MQPLRFKPSLKTAKGTELPLSGESMIELLRAVIAKGLPFRFRLRGHSMYPFLKHGDVVTVYPLMNVMPKCGDIVAIIHPRKRKLAIHRIIGKTGMYFVTKGDNNHMPDGLIPETDVLSLVKKVERSEKEVSLGLGSEKVVIAFLSKNNIFPRFFYLIRNFFLSIMKRASR